MFISKVFSFFFVCMLSVCGNSVSQIENANQSQQKERTELSLKMERFGCRGQCPAYDVFIQTDGKVLFDGKGYTKITGKAEGKITEEQLKQLIVEIDKSDFFSFDDSYTYNSKNCPTMATDMPTVTIFIKLNGREKTIEHYWGCWINDESKRDNYLNTKIEKSFSPPVFPQQLYNLENKIDEIVETKRWVGKQE